MTSAEALDAMRPEIRPMMARKLYLNLHARQALAAMHGNKLGQRYEVHSRPTKAGEGRE